MAVVVCVACKGAVSPPPVKQSDAEAVKEFQAHLGNGIERAIALIQLAPKVQDKREIVEIEKKVAAWAFEENAWLIAHPPRPCFAEAQADWSAAVEHLNAAFDWMGEAAAANENFTTSQKFAKGKGYLEGCARYVVLAKTGAQQAVCGRAGESR